MRKAFEKNVARRRPRLRGAAGGPAPAAPEAQPAASSATGAAVRLERLEKIQRRLAEVAVPAPRLELERIRRRVAEASRRAPSAVSPPAASAPEDVLSLLGVLGVELARARQREEALRGQLRGQLHSALGEPARSGVRPQGPSERLAAVHAEYLAQVAAHRRARSAPVPCPGRPAAAVDGGLRRSAAREGEQPELAGRVHRAAFAAGAVGA